MTLKELDVEIRSLEDRKLSGEDVEATLVSKTESFNSLAKSEKSRKERQELLLGLASIEVGRSQDEKVKEGLVFKNAAHFYHDVYRAGPRGESKSRELQAYVSKTVGSDEMAVVPDAEGGYLVPTQHSSSLVERVLEVGLIKPKSFRIPMATGSLKMPGVQDQTTNSGTMYGGIQLYYKAERAALTPSQPKFREISLSTHKLTAFVPVTNELLKFSPISVAAWLDRKVPEAIAWKEDQVFLLGTGAGEPKGCLVGADALPRGGGADNVLRQTQNRITFLDVCYMYACAFRKNAGNYVWIANDQCLPELMRLSFEGTSSSVPAYMPAGGLSGKPYDTLLGRPLYWSEHLSALGTAKDFCLVDLGHYYTGEVGGIEGQTSIHLRFDYDETAFRFIIHHDGQSSWETYFTPDNGLAQSPFIYLPSHS